MVGLNLEDLPLIFLIFLLILYKFNNLKFTSFDKISVTFVILFIVYSNIFTENFKLFNQTNLRFYFYFLLGYLITDYIKFTNSKFLELFDPLSIVMIINFLIIIFNIQLPGTIDGWILNNSSNRFILSGRLGGIQGGGPNVIGAICALYSLTCIFKILNSENKINYIYKNKVNSVLLLITLFNLLLTFSRGSYLALIVGFFTLIFFEKSITKKRKFIISTSIIFIVIITIFMAPSVFLKQSNRSFLSSIAVNNLDILNGVGGGNYIKEVYKDYLITLDKQTLNEKFNIQYDENESNSSTIENESKSGKYVEGYFKLNFDYRDGLLPRSKIKFYYSNDGVNWSQIGSDFTNGTVINLMDNNSFFEVGGWGDGQSPDDSYLDGYISELRINTGNKNIYKFNEDNRDTEFFIYLPASKELYDNRNDGPIVFNDMGLKLIRPRSYWIAIPNNNDTNQNDFEITLKLSLDSIPGGNETLFSQSSILNNSEKINDQSWKWSIVNGRMYFFWIENVNEGYSNYLGGQSIRTEKIIINDNNFETTVSNYTISQYDEITTAHNGFLTMAVEYGSIITILIIFGLFFLILKNFYRENNFELSLIFLLLTQNLTNDLIYAPDVAIFFWIVPFFFLANLTTNQE